MHCTYIILCMYVHYSLLFVHHSFLDVNFFVFLDIDECQTRRECDLTKSTCIDLAGSFWCKCLPGYIQINNKTCRRRMFHYWSTVLKRCERFMFSPSSGHESVSSRIPFSTDLRFSLFLPINGW